jgi:quercetin dioxygenase-like cupin family protein
MRRLRAAFLAAAVALVALAAGPPLVSAITATLFVTSTLEDRVKVKNDGIKLKTKRPTDVHVQEANFERGDFVDWHDHPGFALIAVKTGTMTFIDQHCTEHVIGPGKAIVESGGPTYAVNRGTERATFYVTYVVPKGSPRIIENVGPPRCAKKKDKGKDDKGKDHKGDKDDDDKGKDHKGDKDDDDDKGKDHKGDKDDDDDKGKDHKGDKDDDDDDKDEGDKDDDEKYGDDD